MDKLQNINEGQFKCEECTKSFTNYDALRRHSRMHNGERPYKCVYCNRSFLQTNALIKHLHRHLGDDIYTCDFCPQSFRLHSELRKHLPEHKNDDAETRKRHLAARQQKEKMLNLKLFSDPGRAETRKDTIPEIQKNATNQYHCTECCKNFPSLDEHKKNCRERPFVCPICLKKFYSQYYLKHHVKIHDGNKKEKICNICNKDKENHVETVNEDSFKCDQSPMDFTEFESLREHNSHPGKNPFKCTYCDQTYANSKSLINHLRKHLGGDIYTCDFCPQSFHIKKEMREHFEEHKHDDAETRERHLAARQQKEKLLDLKLFSDPTMHMRTHIVKNYMCTYCEQSYSTSTSLKTHLRKHLGDEIYKCEICPLSFRLKKELREHFAEHKTDDDETKNKHSADRQQNEVFSNPEELDKPFAEHKHDDNEARKNYLADRQQKEAFCNPFWWEETDDEEYDGTLKQLNKSINNTFDENMKAMMDAEEFIEPYCMIQENVSIKIEEDEEDYGGHKNRSITSEISLEEIKNALVHEFKQEPYFNEIIEENDDDLNGMNN